MIRATLTKLKDHSAETRAPIERIGKRSVRDRTTFQTAAKTETRVA
jgi:hypothetical protein